MIETITEIVTDIMVTMRVALVLMETNSLCGSLLVMCVVLLVETKRSP